MVIRRQTILLLVLSLILSASTAASQDARESLGPKDGPAQGKGPHPLAPLMTTLNSSLWPELRGKHPCVYVTESEIEKLRERSRTTHRDLWQRALRRIGGQRPARGARPATGCFHHSAGDEKPHDYSAEA